MRKYRAWEHVRTLRRRPAVFRLIFPFVLNEWRNQHFVVRKSKRLQRPRRAKNLFDLIRTGEFEEVKL